MAFVLLPPMAAAGLPANHEHLTENRNAGRGAVPSRHVRMWTAPGLGRGASQEPDARRAVPARNRAGRMVSRNAHTRLGADGIGIVFRWNALCKCWDLLGSCGAISRVIDRWGRRFRWTAKCRCLEGCSWDQNECRSGFLTGLSVDPIGVEIPLTSAGPRAYEEGPSLPVCGVADDKLGDHRVNGRPWQLNSARRAGGDRGDRVDQMPLRPARARC